MSRHRFVRNLTEDDYYDDVDEDDYYDDEPSYSQSSQRNKGAITGKGTPGRGTAAPTAKKTAIVSMGTPPVLSSLAPHAQPTIEPEGGITIESSIKAQPLTDPARIDKEQMLIAMGFTHEQACMALAANNWDVQQALEYNLLVQHPRASSVTHVYTHPLTLDKHPTKERIHTSSKSMKGVKTLPPPGFGSPPDSVERTTPFTFKSPSNLVTQQTLADSNKSMQKVSIEPCTPIPSTPDSNMITTNVSPKSTRKKNPKILDSFASEKSRLSMVILGHVDAGKSTLMGQVLLQLGYIEKRTVTKYRKQGMYSI